MNMNIVGVCILIDLMNGIHWILKIAQKASPPLVQFEFNEHRRRNLCAWEKQQREYMKWKWYGSTTKIHILWLIEWRIHNTINATNPYFWTVHKSMHTLRHALRNNRIHISNIKCDDVCVMCVNDFHLTAG